MRSPPFTLRGYLVNRGAGLAVDRKGVGLLGEGKGVAGVGKLHTAACLHGARKAGREFGGGFFEERRQPPKPRFVSNSEGIRVREKEVAS